MYVKLLVLLTTLVLTVCKDVSERERASRAAFIQRLLNKQKYLEGKVKLVGGSNFEGNVYIYHAGRWGAVCDDSWDGAAAAVVCRSLNRTGVATRGGQYGEATEKYWMDDVVCEGDEESLVHCLFSGWGSSDCGADEAAGVICEGRLGQPCTGDCEGRMGTPGCTAEECQELKRRVGTPCIGEDCPKGRVGTPCTENCEQEGRVGTACTEDCEKRGVDCKDVACLGRMGRLSDVIDVGTSLRLVGGAHSREGRVEVYLNGTWGSVCADGWTIYEASVVCRHLAAGYATHALATALYGGSAVTLRGVRCGGDEGNLFTCGVRPVEGCPGEAGHVAAVVCEPHLADLQLDTAAIEQSAHLQDAPMFTLQCAMEENCLSRSAYEIQRTNENWQFETRRLLRFTAASLNVGDAEFRPYLPKHLWQWHLCHMHYHSMEVFATFDVLDSSGRRVAEGHKASFCLEDNTCQPGVERKYSCKNYGDQGVSVNCSDVYQYNIDCQWVDVTDVTPGDYTFKVSVNPHARVPEQSYHNNAATCQLRLTETYALVYNCRLGRP